MSRLLRILTAPFRFLYWFNYRDARQYSSAKAEDAFRVPTRPLTPAELGRTTRQIEDIASSLNRFDPPGSM